MYTYVYLKNKGIKIFKNDKQILTNGYSVDYPKQKTQLILGEHLIKQEEYEISEIDYNKLKEFDIVVAQKEETIPFSTGRKIYYYLSHESSQAKEYGSIPENHKLIFDSLTRSVQLKGKHVKGGETDWLQIDRTIEKEKEETYESVLTGASEIMESLYPEGTVNRQRHINVPEICIGISAHGELVCIPKSRDAPRIGMAGESGMGKTWLIHRIKDQCVEKGYARVIEINDRKKDSSTYTEPWQETSRFSKQLKIINEQPKPLPMIYLHPINDKIKDNHLISPGEVGFKISMPSKKLLRELQMFSCYYDLGKSQSYLSNISENRPEFFEKETVEEMKEVIDEAVKNKEIPPQSKAKIQDFLNSIKRSNILDITNGEPSSWEVEVPEEGVYEGYPWICSLIAGLSVSIETGHIVKEKYYPVLLNFLLTNIFEEKKTNQHLMSETLMIFADEIPDIMKNKKAYEIMDEVIRTGRSDGVGFCIATQYYEEIFPSIRTNLSHFVIFKQPLHSKRMKQDHFLRYPEMYKEVQNLKNRECILCGEYILYNPITGKRYENNGVPIKTKLLPPNSKHKAPPNVKSVE